jgi:hypothetical protein
VLRSRPSAGNAQWGRVVDRLRRALTAAGRGTKEEAVVAAIDIDKIQRVEDMLTGSDFGSVTVEWRMEPGSGQEQKRTWRVSTPKVPAEPQQYLDSQEDAMDGWVAVVNAGIQEKDAANAANRIAIDEAQALVNEEFPPNEP